MKAIFTKYQGPTNTKGSRIIASDEDGNRVSISLDNRYNSDTNHKLAVAALCRKMNWTGELVSGSLSNGYVWVFVDNILPDDRLTITPLSCDKCGLETADVRKRDKHQLCNDCAA